MQLYLRHLDIDDLIILKSLLEPDLCLKNIARSLGLTPPALTHRLNKYRTYIPNFELATKKLAKKTPPLTEETIKICNRAKQALDTLLSMDMDKVA